MEAKEKAIMEAYGEHYEALKDYIWHADGSLDKDVFVETNISYEDISDIGFTHTDHFCTPKSLQGISNNNKWVRIESEADLPKETDKYWVMRNGVIDIGTYSLPYNKWMCSGQYYFATLGDLKITHYQPIIKPLKPIY
jgi:hypothetical protein